MRRLVSVLVALLALASGSAAAEPTPETGGPAGRFDRPRHGFASPRTVLRDGTPEQVGLDAGPLDAALADVRAWTEGPGRPLFSGAVTLLAHDGVVVRRDSAGYAVRYAGLRADGSGQELPREQWVPTGVDTIYDLASISKLFTSIVVMQQVEAGRIRVEAPVSRYLPEFAANGKGAVTVRQLLTHTSGLEPFLPLWRDWPDKPSRVRAVLEAKPQAEPGKKYVYSDLNLITLGVLAERVSGSDLDSLVRRGITEPLGMRDTGYNPPASVRHRVAATEFTTTPPRGVVRGEVHDENAWSLGGVAGHAGIFATADDLAVLGQTILNGGSYRGRRVLRPDTVRRMLANYNSPFPDNAHGLGFELDQRWYMDGLSGPRTAGHTGFTGTSLVIDPVSRSVAVLLTNRVHPSRNWGSVNPARQAVARGLAQAMAVRPVAGDEAWFSGVGDQRTATLRTPPMPVRSGPVSVCFNAFVDTEPTDTLTLESSVDGGSSWTAVPVSARGPGAPADERPGLAGAGHRRWWTVRAELHPTGRELLLRWRYTTDQRYSGRGVYLDDLRVEDERGVLFDDEREPGRLTAGGWRPAGR
ncbi:serine hydrolase domain-containing protein [Streptoalloteichus hindustanus]|uniref:CubicO group peptidase, beta-lactamase class C family n=1 Tax=Streptoalloteichus hindustanus TaxID=2017 RepID=A0A1M4VVA2_STRHI|nr:serine hydrolase domain-containing protein [Streptoalloteichus hindustanus]SHE72878.1 CubicO group peptidase, beta-lactamase class C family [Streptoalloteichus hindustanus]